MARAVHHAHERGVLHRDLKPSNVLLDPHGEPHLTDFGLAKRLEAGAAELTGTGAILGTPAYMAPEQAGGQRGEVTTATDVYGLGALLYALLTGHAPFRGESVADTLVQVRGGSPEPVNKSNAKVPRDLETVCMRCLEREPAGRYASADAVADDLERWIKGEPIAARPVGKLERGLMWCRRNPAVAGLTASVAAALILGTSISTVLAFRANDQARAERRQRDQAENAENEARNALDQNQGTYAAHADPAARRRRRCQRFPGAARGPGLGAVGSGSWRRRRPSRPARGHAHFEDRSSALREVRAGADRCGRPRSAETRAGTCADVETAR